MTSVAPLRLRLAGAIAGNPPVNTVLPVVTGTLNEGDTLTTTTGTWTGDATITYTYQWYYTPSTAISGKTTSTYIIQVGDAGASVFCKVTATNSVSAVSANSTAVGPVTVASSTYDGFAATHLAFPQSLGGTTATNVRSGHWARTAITQLKILCPNYYGGSEVAPGATMGIKASVEYPAGHMTGQQILFSGSASGTIPNGGTLVSDYLTIAIPNGDRFWIRCHLTCSAGIVYIAGSYLDVGGADGSNFMGFAWDDSATDLTMSGVITPVETSSYCPVVIAPMTVPSVLILGDSIDVGVGDKRDVDGNVGVIARTVGPKFGYCNTGIPGESAVSYFSSHTQRLQLSYCTHVFVGFGANDVVAGRTKAQIEADLTSIYGLCSTKTVFGRTITPNTTDPSNTWSTTGGQTVAVNESVRAALNVDLRSTFHPAGGVFDIGAVVETSTKWVPNKTGDGLHPNYSGNLDIAASGAINTALIGTPAAPLTETGSAWGDHGTKITVSTRRRSNDTAAPNTTGNPSTTVRGVSGNSSGLKYFEIECLGTQTSNFVVGLMTNATANGALLDDYMGDIPDSFGIANGAAYNFVSGTIFSPTTIGSMAGLTNAGDVWGMAVDFTNKYAWLSRNGVYFLSGDPTTGAGAHTGSICHWTGTPTLYPGLTMYGAQGLDPLGLAYSNTPIRLRTASLLYAPPSGYSAWG